ncbi:MAG: calcium-binding protein, partial [Hyphomicrobiaceae bacterium]
ADGGTEGDFMYTSLTNGATLHGNSGNDAIACGNVGSSLYGESGADTCFGGFGADFINGGSESDAVGGYYGNDTLYGGTGGDYFNMLYDTRVGELDTIGDWNTGGAQDFLLFSAQYASNTGWFQSGANVYAYQTLGTGTYYVYIANANVANVQANTFFL